MGGRAQKQNAGKQLDHARSTCRFFLPCGLLVFKEKTQVIITLLASVLAGPALFFWVLVWGTPQAGGVLAIVCWISLFLVSLIYCWRWAFHWWRQRKALG
ncbi:hypothetical protein UNDKW_3618 [Undibacterium sp. KW1]|nr:hypothetical protein UNDKW_3618 [Undibacterium sp. KW1]